MDGQFWSPSISQAVGLALKGAAMEPELSAATPTPILAPHGESGRGLHGRWKWEVPDRAKEAILYFALTWSLELISTKWSYRDDRDSLTKRLRKSPPPRWRMLWQSPAERGPAAGKSHPARASTKEGAASSWPGGQRIEGQSADNGLAGFREQPAPHSSNGLLAKGALRGMGGGGRAAGWVPTAPASHA